MQASSYIAAFSRGAKPLPPLSVSDWAEKYRILSSKSSAEAGPWRNSRTPYLVEIMDALSVDSPYQRVVFEKGSQIGGTEVGNNWLGYLVHHAPGPILYVMPTTETVKKNSKLRVAPLFEETPVLKERVKAPRSRDSGNTLLMKEFEGGAMMLTGGNSASGLRSIPAKNCFLDEIDEFPADVDGEGDPIELVEARQRTFGRFKKLYMVSSPTIKNASRIEAEFDISDQRYYFVPCPHCGHYQALKFPNLKWNAEGDDIDVWYECESCAERIEESSKTMMLERGEWRATSTSAQPGTVGFHLSSLYSPLGWMSWEEIVRQWLKAQKDPLKLKVFINTVLGETFEERGEAPDWEKIYARREFYDRGVVPKGGIVLLAAADIQKDRIEVEVQAFGKNMESWSVDHIVILGDPRHQSTWGKLTDILNQQFEREDGAKLTIRLMAIDSGYLTTYVYNWGRSQGPDRVMVIKGKDSQNSIISRPVPMDYTWKGQKVKRGVHLWHVGVGLVKDELYAFLRLRPEPGQPIPFGYKHYPDYDEKYFQQLVAEYRVRRKHGSTYRFIWVKPEGVANEALDLNVYVRVAAERLRLVQWSEAKWDEINASLLPDDSGASKQSRGRKKRRPGNVSRGVTL